MKKSERLEVYLIWIIDAVEKVKRYTQGFDLDKFSKDGMIIDACLMQFIHIGETANKVSKKYPECNIITSKVIGLRNFIAHDYMEVRISLIWNIINTNLPQLKKDILEYLSTIEKS